MFVHNNYRPANRRNYHDRGRNGRTSFIKEYDSSINLHEHEEDDKGNGLEHIKKCREEKSSKVKSKYKCKVRKYKGY